MEASEIIRIEEECFFCESTGLIFLAGSSPEHIPCPRCSNKEIKTKEPHHELHTQKRPER